MTIESLATSALKLVLGVLDKSKGEGVHLRVQHRDLTEQNTGEEFSAFIGKMTDDDKEPCSEYSAEKIGRMRAIPAHKTSWATRLPEHGMFGGGIGTPKFYIASSGLSEHGDEAVDLVLSVAAGWLSADEAFEIAYGTGNNVYMSLIILDSDELEREQADLVSQIKPTPWWTAQAQASEGVVIVKLALLDGVDGTAGTVFRSFTIKSVEEAFTLLGTPDQLIGVTLDEGAFLDAFAEAALQRTAELVGSINEQALSLYEDARRPKGPDIILLIVGQPGGKEAQTTEESDDEQ